MDLIDADCGEREGIPVTGPSRTLIDLATLLSPGQLEECVNRADKLRLIDPESLRRQIDENRGMDGVASLRRILDRRTFALTDSELERRFLRLVGRARLPVPKTQQRVAGFRVDFFWPDLRLVVETDGLRYHRTASQQARDRVRDQALVAAGFTVLRFTHAQVTYEPDHVVAILKAAAHRVSSALPPYRGQSARNPG
jgi:very-short-patch-repair endonuclease